MEEKKNSCGECTLCCELLAIPVLNKPENVLCSFCDNGCSIHNQKPDECTNFDCAYLQMDKVNINLRPDKCHVIFEKIDDEIYLGVIDYRHEIGDIVKGQVNSFLAQGFSVILKKSDEKNIIIHVPIEGDGKRIHDIYENKVKQWQHQIITQTY